MQLQSQAPIQSSKQQRPQQPLQQTQKQPHPSPSYIQLFLTQQKSKIKLSQEYLFLKVMIGKYFIQAYRVFRMVPQINAIVFWKRHENKTHYNFFVLFESVEQMRKALEQSIGKEGVSVEGMKKSVEKMAERVDSMKKSVEKMTRKELVDYSISLALVQQLKKLNFPTLAAYHSFLTSLLQSPNTIIPKLTSTQPMSSYESHQSPKTQPPYTIESFNPSLKKQHEQLLFQSKEQFNTLKELMSVYLDTFGNEEKGRKIYKEIDKSSGSFSVDLLLNTLNYMIFQEVNNSCYSQIEPCYWTCFQSSTKQLNSDRKHIALTGSGQICVLQIIFLKALQTQNKIEYSMMLTEFRKFYKKAKIKIYRILNQIWNGEVQKIDLEDGPAKKSSAPAIIYKFDVSKTNWEYPAPTSK